MSEKDKDKNIKIKHKSKDFDQTPDRVGAAESFFDENQKTEEDQFACSIFKLIDRNCDNSLDQDELRGYLTNLGIDDIAFTRLMQLTKLREFIDQNQFVYLVQVAGVPLKVLKDLHDKIYFALNKCLGSCCFKDKAKQKRIENDFEDMQKRRKAKMDGQEERSWIDYAMIMFAGVSNAQEVLNTFTDVLLIRQFYTITMEKIAQQDTNQSDYKLLFLISSLTFSSKFYIACSTMNFMVFYEGQNGANIVRPNMNCYKKGLMYLKFTAVSPLIFIMMKIFNALEVVIMIAFIPLIILAVPFQKSQDMIKKYKNATKKWERIFNLMCDFTSQQMATFKTQMSIIDLNFNIIPEIVVNLLVIFQVFNAPEFIEDNEQECLLDDCSEPEIVKWFNSPKVVLQLSLVVNILKVVAFIVQTYIASKVYQESPSEQMLNTAKGLFGWIPYYHKFETGKMSNVIDFEQMFAMLPFVSNSLGIYHKLKFNFSNTNIQNLSNMMRVLNSTMNIQEHKNQDGESQLIYDLGRDFEATIKCSKLQNGVIFSQAIPSYEIKGSLWEESSAKALFFKDGKLCLRIGKTTKEYEVKTDKKELNIKLRLHQDKYRLKIQDDEEVDTELKKVKDSIESFFIEGLQLDIGQELKVPRFEGDKLEIEIQQEKDNQNQKKLQKKKVKYEFVLNNSFKNCSINKILDLIDNIDADRFEIVTQGLKWEDVFEFSVNTMIFQTSRDKQDYRTDSGKPLIMVCIDKEIRKDQDEETKNNLSNYTKDLEAYMNECLTLLLKGAGKFPRADPNVENESTGQTMLFHALINAKTDSATILLENGADFFKVGSNNMNCLAACISTPNAQILKEVMNKNQAKLRECLKSDIQVIDYSIGLDRYVPLTHYIFLKLRHSIVKKNETQQKELMKIIQDLREAHTFTQDQIRQAKEGLLESFDCEYNQQLMVIHKAVETMFGNQEFQKLEMSAEECNEDLEHFVHFLWRAKDPRKATENYYTYCEKVLKWDKVKSLKNILVAGRVNGKYGFPGKENDRNWILYGAECELRDKHNINFSEQMAQQEAVTMLNRRNNKTKNGEAGGPAGGNQRTVSNGSDRVGFLLVPGERSAIHENDNNVIEQERQIKSLENKTKDQAAMIQNQNDEFEKRTRFNKKLDRSSILKTLNFILEATAACDMVSDIAVIIQLIDLHPAWVTFTVLTMVAPFFITYTPLINFQLKGYYAKKMENDGKLSMKDSIMSFFSLTPIVTIILIAMDFLYIIQGIIISPFVWLINKCCKFCKRKDRDGDEQDLNDWLEEEIYRRTFAMNREEITGFRRLRTISQLMFETIPQIFLQIRILAYIYETNTDSSPNQRQYLQNEINSIMISIVFALTHGGLEILILVIEARIFGENILDYFVICINGRLGWVPFLHKFRGQQDPEFFKGLREKPLRYDDINSTFCGNENKDSKVNCSKLFGSKKVQIDYEFGNQTAIQLASAFFTLSEVKEKAARPNIEFGDSVDNINFTSLIIMIQFSMNRINLHFTGTKLEQMILESKSLKTEMEAAIQNKTFSSSIEILVRDGQTQVLGILLRAKKWNIGENIDLESNDKLVQICLDKEDFSTLKVLMEHGCFITNIMGNKHEFFEVRNKFEKLNGKDWVNKYIPGNNSYGKHGKKEIWCPEDWWPDYGLYGWGGSKPGGGYTNWGFRVQSNLGGNIMIDFAQKKLYVGTPYVAQWEMGNGQQFESEVLFAFHHLLSFVHDRLGLPLDSSVHLYQCGTNYTFYGDTKTLYQRGHYCTSTIPWDKFNTEEEVISINVEKCEDGCCEQANILRIEEKKNEEPGANISPPSDDSY